MPASFPWAHEAFGVTEPEAVNLWIGNEQAVSFWHKDHYENLFHVLSGEKVFTLCPPADAPYLPEHPVPSGQFRYRRRPPTTNDNNNKEQQQRQQPSPYEWAVQMDYQEEKNKDGSTTKEPVMVHWIATDPCESNNSPNPLDAAPLGDDAPFQNHPPPQNQQKQLGRAHPLRVTVQAGQILYLPSSWFHHVTQTCETVAMNYWYEMNFESPLWCYFHFLQQLRPSMNQPPSRRQQEEEETIE